MKHLIFLAALACPTVTAAAGAEGIWFGGTAGGPREWDHKPAQITFQPVIVEDLIKVTLKADGWKGFAIANCIYYGRLDASGAASLLLNAPASNADRCPQTLPVALTQVDRDTLDLSVPSPEIEGLPQQPMRLSAVLRDLYDDEMSTLPKGADILGVHPGMSFAEAEKILLERGYARHEKSDKAFETLTRKGQWIVFGKDPHVARSWDFADMITLSLATVDKETGDPRAAQIIGIRREAKPGGETGLKIATLEKALSGKYGTASGTVFYDRTGQVADRGTWCQETPMQGVPLRTSSMSHSAINPTCGSQVSVSSRGDMATGLAGAYNVSIVSVPPAARDFWAQIRGAERAPIAEFVEAQEAPTTAAPEL